MIVWRSKNKTTSFMSFISAMSRKSYGLLLVQSRRYFRRSGNGTLSGRLSTRAVRDRLRSDLALNNPQLEIYRISPDRRGYRKTGSRYPSFRLCDYTSKQTPPRRRSEISSFQPDKA